jgi:hypothetical protein
MESLAEDNPSRFRDRFKTEAALSTQFFAPSSLLFAFAGNNNLSREGLKRKLKAQRTFSGFELRA